MRLTVIGCSGSFPGPASPASCYLVQAEHEGRTWSIALDLGNGSLGVLQRHLDLRELDAVLLTHLHPDHCADACGLYVFRHYHPSGMPRARLPLYGPAGTSERLAAMYHGLEGGTMSSVYAVDVVSEQTVIDLGPFHVTAHRMNHPVETYGYRVHADGAVLAYTGDTDSCPQLTPLMRDADLAIVDCAFVDGRDDARGIHLSGSRAAAAAREAGGVGELMLSHMPAWNDPQVCLAQARAAWEGRISLAEVGLTRDLG